MATVEQTLMKVQRIIAGSMKLRATVIENGYQVVFSDMSTALNIRVSEWTPDTDGEPQTLVELHALILRDVTPTPALFEWIARNAGNYVFGRVGVYDHDSTGKVYLVFAHTLLGDYLDEPELRTAMLAVLLTADASDDDLQRRFGGKRWVDA